MTGRADRKGRLSDNQIAFIAERSGVTSIFRGATVFG